MLGGRRRFKLFAGFLVVGAFYLAVGLPGGASAYSVLPAAGTALTGSALVTAAPATWNTGGGCTLVQFGGAPNGTLATGFVSFDVHADALANCQGGSQSTYAGFVFSFSCAPVTCPARSAHTFVITVNWTANWYIRTSAVASTNSSSVATVFLYSSIAGIGTCVGSGSSTAVLDTHSLTSGSFTHSVTTSPVVGTTYLGSVTAGCSGFSITTYLAGTTHAVGGAGGGAYAETDLRYFGPVHLDLLQLT